MTRTYSYLIKPIVDIVLWKCLLSFLDVIIFIGGTPR